MSRLLFGAVAALTLCSLVQPSVGRSAPRARPAPAATLRATAEHPLVQDLYSLRARRRMATYLRLRLLEWREAGLERAAQVVEHRLSVDALVPPKH